LFPFGSVVNILLLIGIDLSSLQYSDTVMLLGQQEGHLACKYLGDGMLVVMI